jgi:hypothetical protein
MLHQPLLGDPSRKLRAWSGARPLGNLCSRHPPPSPPRRNSVSATCLALGALQQSTARRTTEQVSCMRTRDDRNMAKGSGTSMGDGGVRRGSAFGLSSQSPHSVLVVERTLGRELS